MTTCVSTASADNTATDVGLGGHSCLAAAPSRQQLQRANQCRIDQSLGESQLKAIYTMWSYSRSAWHN